MKTTAYISNFLNYSVAFGFQENECVRAVCAEIVRIYTLFPSLLVLLRSIIFSYIFWQLKKKFSVHSVVFFLDQGVIYLERYKFVFLF